MGSLQCKLDDSQWSCTNTTANLVNDLGLVASNTSCAFPFTLVDTRTGVNTTFSTCQSIGQVSPPGFDAIRFGSDFDFNSTFWCSDAPVLYSNSGGTHVGRCNCTGSNAKPETDEDGKDWLKGVLFASLSSFATALGTIMQKWAHNMNDAKPPEKRAKEWIGLLLSPAWIASFLLMVLVPLPVDFIAFSLAAQSLLVPFAGLTIVLNQLCAPILLSEKLTRIEIFGTFVILVGLIVSTAMGPKVDVQWNACQIVDRYTDPDFLIVVICLFSAIGFVLYQVHYAPESPFQKRVRPALFAFLAGGFGGVSNIFFKAVGELAALGVANGAGSGWSTAHPYYNILGAIVFAILQISHINQGLRLYSAVLYIPLYNCVYIIMSGGMGAVMYKEFHLYNTLQWVLFPLGVFITICGIMIMTRRTPGQTQSASAISPNLQGDAAIPIDKNTDNDS